MNTTAIRKKLQDYIRVADDRKIEAIYTMLEHELDAREEWWNDQEFINLLTIASNDLKNGTDKGVAWNHLKESLLRNPNQ